jgi:catechol 2,3-dioxygenase-like lactoylglutathione lyase family enzyme
MPILSLDHVQIAIPVGGETQAREFYTGILGLTEVEKPAEMAGRNSIWFVAGPVNLHVGIEPDFRPANARIPRLSSMISTISSRLASAPAISLNPTPPSTISAASTSSILSVIASN